MQKDRLTTWMRLLSMGLGLFIFGEMGSRFLVWRNTPAGMEFQDDVNGTS
jgi:hypothetical protein